MTAAVTVAELREALAGAARLVERVREQCGDAVRDVHSMVSADGVALFLMGPADAREIVRALIPANDALRVVYVALPHGRQAHARNKPVAAPLPNPSEAAPPLAPADFAFLDYLVKKALEPWTRGT